MTQQETDMEMSREDAWESTPDPIALAILEQAKRFYADDRLDRARELAETLISMRPDAGPCWAFLGVIHRRQDRLVAALQCLQRAAELDPTDRNALANLGESLVLAGKLEEGARILRALFEMGYVPGTPPEEQDPFTRRAGAQLALLQKVLQALERD